MEAEELSFENAFTQLEETVSKLEQGNIPLEEAVNLFEQGMLLADRCNSLLDAAEFRVSQLEVRVLDEPNMDNAIADL